MRKLLTAGLVLTMMALVPNTSDAAPIFGSIELTGPMAPTGGTTLNDATGVDFTANAGVFVAGSGVYDPAVSGFSFPFTIATMTDFSFVGFVGPVTLWTIAGGYSLVLEDITFVDQTISDVLTLKGLGTLTAPGYDNTTGEWVFTGNTTSNSTFSFSSSQSAVAEPASTLLLGLALLGTAGVVRRRLHSRN